MPGVLLVRVAPDGDLLDAGPVDALDAKSGIKSLAYGIGYLREAARGP
jgi:hypothetical protein